MKLTKKRLFPNLFVLALLSLACTTTLDPFDGPGVKVLFIGNSLTYTNDLPGTVAGLMSMAGEEMSYLSVAGPNLALVDHLDGATDAVKQVKRGGWDIVVLQQGPSSLPENREDLVSWTIEFDHHIRSVGARTALYMVWPDRSRMEFFDDVRVSYKTAADTVGGLFIPAGEAWLTAWGADSTLHLYGLDDFHPSSLGTYLAALTMFEKIIGRDTRELPTEVVVGGRTVSVPDSTVRLLQAAAHEVCEKYP